MFAYIIPAIVFMVCLRFYAAYVSKKEALITDADSIVHLAYLKEYYKNKGAPMDMSYLYTLDTSDYPNGFHKLFYYLRISVAWLEKFGGYLPTLFDLLMFALIVVAVKIFGGENYIWLACFPFLRLFFFNEGRAHHFSERAYGVLWGNAYLLCIAAFYVTGNWMWLAGAILPFCLFSISSVFTWQATFFISFLLSMFTQDALFITAYLVIGVLSFLLTKGYSFVVLQGAIRHCYFYKTYLAKRYFGLKYHYPELFRYKGLRNYLYMLFTNAPLRLITDTPILWIMIYAVLMTGDINFWVIWAFAGIFMVIVISTETLKFLGEPERYLEFTIIPVFIYLSYVSVSDYPEVTAGTFAVMLGVFLVHWYLYFTGMENTVPRQLDMIELRKFFSTISGKNILTVPFRLSFFLGYENQSNKFITLFANIGAEKKGQDYRWLMIDRYPYVRSNLPEVISRFDIDYLVVEKGRAGDMDKTFNGKYYDFSAYKIVYDNQHYQVLKAK